MKTLNTISSRMPGWSFMPLLSITLLVAFCAGCSGSSEPQFRHDGFVDFLAFENGSFSILSTIEVEMADENRERMQGLKHRSNMAEDQGMYFLFPREGPLSFWMQDTPIPLDIIYVNSNLQIVDIYENTTPFSESQLPSSDPAMYVVEVNGGYCSRHGIAEGHYIQTRPVPDIR